MLIMNNQKEKLRKTILYKYIRNRIRINFIKEVKDLYIENL